jgi:hypothetical protein
MSAPRTHEPQEIPVSLRRLGSPAAAPNIYKSVLRIFMPLGKGVLRRRQEGGRVPSRVLGGGHPSVGEVGFRRLCRVAGMLRGGPARHNQVFT